MPRMTPQEHLAEVRSAQKAVVRAEKALRIQCARAMRQGCTGEQVAAALGVSRATLYRFIAEDVERHASQVERDVNAAVRAALSERD